jgi:hypothetical protein
VDLCVILGIVLLVLTCWDYWRAESDATILFDLLFDWWWGWFDVSRDSFPLFYWMCLITQAVAGVALIIYGMFT